VVSAECHYTGRYQTLQANIKLGWNLLQYFSVNYKRKSFVELAYGQNKKNISFFKTERKKKVVT
jgi:hypothetical protein